MTITITTYNNVYHRSINTMTITITTYNNVYHRSITTMTITITTYIMYIIALTFIIIIYTGKYSAVASSGPKADINFATDSWDSPARVTAGSSSVSVSRGKDQGGVGGRGQRAQGVAADTNWLEDDWDE